MIAICTEKKRYDPPFTFSNKNSFTSKRKTVFFVLKKYIPPFNNKNILLLKGWQCLRKYAPPFNTKILLLQSFT